MSRVAAEIVHSERVGCEHLVATSRALDAFVDEVPRLEQWGRRLAITLLEGGRLLVAGNGGSAALSQHLTSELVGRYRAERTPLSAIALHAETSALTALVNDYGIDEMFARQVRAHGRRNDTFLALSSSGQSRNLTWAVPAARDIGMTTWALTGPAPNPLAYAVDSAICVSANDTATVQEVQQVAVHILCEILDDEVRQIRDLTGRGRSGPS